MTVNIQMTVNMRWYEKGDVFLQSMIVFNEEKRILRYCPLSENNFGYYIWCVVRILVVG